MSNLSEEGSLGPSRRALLVGTGVSLGAALAGCTSFVGDEDEDAQARIQELEAQVTELQEENAALNEQVADFERELATYQRRLDTLNLWGFEEETMQRLQELAYIWTDSLSFAHQKSEISEDAVSPPYCATQSLRSLRCSLRKGA